MNLLISQWVNVDSRGRIFDALERSYTEYFNALGFVLYPISNFIKDLNSYLDDIHYDGLVLSGGGNVNPKFFQEPKKILPTNYSADRDRVEFTLIKKMLLLKLPILGICHGMQQLNCFFGGRITSDIHSANGPMRKAGVTHSVTIKKPIFGINGKFQVNHYHDHGINVDHVAECFDIFAVDSDFNPSAEIPGFEAGDECCVASGGNPRVSKRTAYNIVTKKKGAPDFSPGGSTVVEGIIHKTLPILGMQWHPERKSTDEAFNKFLINHFFNYRGKEK